MRGSKLCWRVTYKEVSDVVKMISGFDFSLAINESLF